MKPGDRFTLTSVVDRYHLRPDYSGAVLEALLESGPRRVLDLGCGPGKLSYLLAPHVEEVVAVDLSAAMLARARGDERDDANINWVEANVDTYVIPGVFDLVTAGASIHWFDHDRLLPGLAGHLAPAGRLAVINGDSAFNPPRGADELAIIKTVQLRINEELPAWVDTVRYPTPLEETLLVHPMFASDGIRHFGPHTVSQTVDDYIETFFSRQAFALDCMPGDAADWFRNEMRHLLQPHAVSGLLTFDVMVAFETGVPGG
ncbi:MAG: hypothetical protein CMQ24_17265 [Gammaproteobacteria bacterium]|nr:hypothetical protein [Gammaproteobacteria bacterium]